jgi:hypothetical protein
MHICKIQVNTLKEDQTMGDVEKMIEQFGAKALLQFVGEAEDKGLSFGDGTPVEENLQALVLDVVRIFISKHI